MTGPSPPGGVLVRSRASKGGAADVAMGCLVGLRLDTSEEAGVLSNENGIVGSRPPSLW